MPTKINISIDCGENNCWQCEHQVPADPECKSFRCAIFYKKLKGCRKGSSFDLKRLPECIDAEGLKPVVQIIAPDSVEVKVE